MSKLLKEQEFNNIANDILNIQEYKNLKKEIHHGISRYDHSLHVAKCSYKLCKFFKVNYKEATRSALLHDFFTNSEVESYNAIKRYRMHPQMALDHSSKYFNLTEKERDAILTHMFPWTLTLPKYKESWIVSLADKIVSVKEGCNSKLIMPIATLFLFLINIISIQK